MDTSSQGISLIKYFEGLKLSAYQCPAGVWTIGFGHTGNVFAGEKITESQAESLLINDIEPTEDKIESFVKVKLNQAQFDALVSFTFNVGVGAFKKSTLLKLLNAGQYTEAAQQFSRWVKAGGQTLPGLVKRRTAESTLFSTGVLSMPKSMEDELEEIRGVIVDLVED